MRSFSVSPSHSLVTGVTEAKVAEKLKEAESETVITEVKTSNTAPTSAPMSPTPIGSSGAITISADSIQKIPPFRPRKSKEWTPPQEVPIFLYIIT